MLFDDLLCVLEDLGLGWVDVVAQVLHVRYNGYSFHVFEVFNRWRPLENLRLEHVHVEAVLSKFFHSLDDGSGLVKFGDASNHVIGKAKEFALVDGFFQGGYLAQAEVQVNVEEEGREHTALLHSLVLREASSVASTVDVHLVLEVEPVNQLGDVRLFRSLCTLFQDVPEQFAVNVVKRFLQVEQNEDFSLCRVSGGSKNVLEYC